jgi:hypothetical protein
MQNPEINIKYWIDDVISRPGGWESWNERELYDSHEKSRDHSVVEFFIRCLANPKCEGSEEVLNLIIEHRKLSQ